MTRNQFNLEQIIDALDKHSQRATYGAVGGVIGVHPLSVMRGLEKCPRYSWVVSSSNHMPTAYKREELHPQLKSRRVVIESPERLAIWLKERI